MISGWFLGKVAAAGLLGLCSWVLVEGASSPAFVVTGVTIDGNELMSKDELRYAISPEGLHVFAIRSNRYERLLQSFPAIRSAHVRPTLPNQVAVVVEERVPSVVWDTGNRQMLLDTEGLALKDGAEPLPTVFAPEGPELQPGGRIDPVPVRVAESVGPRMDSLGLAGGRVEYRPSGGVSLVAPGAPRVNLGFGDDLDAQLTAYVTIRRYLEETRTRAELIDVRFLDRPYYR
jgi:hypothetical protein